MIASIPPGLPIPITEPLSTPHTCRPRFRRIYTFCMVKWNVDLWGQLRAGCSGFNLASFEFEVVYCFISCRFTVDPGEEISSISLAIYVYCIARLNTIIQVNGMQANISCAKCCMFRLQALFPRINLSRLFRRNLILSSCFTLTRFWKFEIVAYIYSFRNIWFFPCVECVGILGELFWEIGDWYEEHAVDLVWLLIVALIGEEEIGVSDCWWASILVYDFRGLSEFTCFWKFAFTFDSRLVSSLA